MRIFALLLLLPPLLATPSAPQDGQEPESGGEARIGRDVYGRPLKTTDKVDAFVAKLMGCWRLVDIEDAEFPADGRSQVGYLLIGQDFLALEMHVAWDDEQGEMVDNDFQSGIHEYRLESTGVLVTSALIGSFLEEYAPKSKLDLEWEDPGTLRKFQLNLAGNFLSLEREDGSRLSFSRQPARHAAERDLFGRERPDSSGKKDVFGRDTEPKKKGGDDDDRR